MILRDIYELRGISHIFLDKRDYSFTSKCDKRSDKKKNKPTTKNMTFDANIPVINEKRFVD